MIMHIDVMHQTDELNQERYRFWVDFPRLVLDYYWAEQRPTKRHKFRAVNFWSRCDRRKNTMQPPHIPDRIGAEALAKARAIIEVSQP